MSFAFLPFYTGDFLRDTSDLTITETGAYFLLLVYCWDSRGPVPPDDARAARIVGASSDDERNIVKVILNRYFVRHDDGWYNPRMDKEIAKANALSGARSEAGKRGASKTWGKKKASAKAIAMASDIAIAMADATTPTPTTTTTPSFSVVPPEKRSSKTLSGKPDVDPKNPSAKEQTLKQNRASAVAVLLFLNAKIHRNYQPVPANIDMIVARLREGFTEQDCKSVVAKKTREWHGDEKMAEFLRPKTLFNRTNFANYHGELVEQGDQNAP